MDAQKLLPFLVTMNAPASERDDLMQLMMPALVDVDDQLRPVIHAMVGQQVLDQQRQEKRLLARRLAEEIPAAIKTLSEGKTLDTARFPTVTRYKLEPILRDGGDCADVPATQAGRAAKK